MSGNGKSCRCASIAWVIQWLEYDIVPGLKLFEIVTGFAKTWHLTYNIVLLTDSI